MAESSFTAMAYGQSLRGDEEESSLKRQKFASRKLCAVSKYLPEEGPTMATECVVGILDLDCSPDWEGFYTDIRFPYDKFQCRGMAFWAVGSTLYGFEGWDAEHLKNPMDGGNSVFTLDLSYFSDFGGDVILDRQMVRQCPPLQHPKYLPAAIQVPGGKILVFTQVFYHRASVGGFEIYDPKDGTSEVLPTLRPHERCIGIHAYSFVRESEFLVQLDKKILVLDLNSRDKGWQVLGSYGGVDRIPYTTTGAFYVLEDRFCFTSDTVSDKAHAFGLVRRHPYPLRPFEKRDRGFAIISPVWYDGVKEVFDFCIFNMNMSEDSDCDYGRVIISECRTNLKEYKKLREGKEAADASSVVEGKLDQVSCDPIVTEVVRTVEFKINDVKYPDITPCYVFLF